MERRAIRRIGLISTLGFYPSKEAWFSLFFCWEPVSKLSKTAVIIPARFRFLQVFCQLLLTLKLQGIILVVQPRVELGSSLRQRDVLPLNYRTDMTMEGLEPPTNISLYQLSYTIMHFTKIPLIQPSFRKVVR